MIVAAVILVFGLIIFLGYYFNRKQIILRKLNKFKPQKILQFKTNELTKVSGKVLRVHEPFIAPLSKRTCVAYVFEIKQRVSNGKTTHWNTLVKKEDIQDFFIEDQGEVVLIKPSRIKSNYLSYIVEDKSITSGTFNNPTPEFAKILQDFGVESTNWFGFNKTLKYTERIIEVGEMITVAGIAKWKTTTEPIAGHNYTRIAALEHDELHKLIITDLPEALIKNQKVR